MACFIAGIGLGHVNDATLDHAWANMEQLVLDSKLEGTAIERAEYDSKGSEDDGRFDFVVKYRDREYTVSMPGIPIERMRGAGALAPRIFVDGNAWLWEYAAEILSE